MLASLELFKWAKQYLTDVTVNGRPMNAQEKEHFMLFGRLPKGAEYPMAMNPENWGHGKATRALLFGSAGGNGPYAIATGEEDFFARQIRPVAAP